MRLVVVGPCISHLKSVKLIESGKGTAYFGSVVEVWTWGTELEGLGGLQRVYGVLTRAWRLVAVKP
jgi:hypothetical protein